jgi:hypothetical protein
MQIALPGLIIAIGFAAIAVTLVGIGVYCLNKKCGIGEGFKAVANGIAGWFKGAFSNSEESKAIYQKSLRDGENIVVDPIKPVIDNSADKFRKEASAAFLNANSAFEELPSPSDVRKDTNSFEGRKALYEGSKAVLHSDSPLKTSGKKTDEQRKKEREEDEKRRKRREERKNRHEEISCSKENNSSFVSYQKN